MKTNDLSVVLKPDEVMALDGSWPSETVSALFTRLFIMATQPSSEAKQRLIIEIDTKQVSQNPLLTVV